MYTLARYDLLHRDQPELDLDRLSASVVKVLDGQTGTREGRYRDMPWEPKGAFKTLTDRYGPGDIRR